MSRSRSRVSKARRLGIALGCTICAALPLRAEVPGAEASVAEAISKEVRGVFERSRSAVIKIESTDGHGDLSGTGFYVDPNGTLFTSYTVGGESRDLIVSDGVRKLPARRIVGDPRSGVAILKVDAETPFLPVGKSRELGVASPVVTVGYPMDLPISPSFGTVAGFEISYGGRYFTTTHIRANLPVQRGQGGAPLLNLRGEAVGILISSLDGGSGTFALPIEAAEKVRKDYMRFGEVRPGWMGIGVRPAAVAIGGSTAQVDEILADAPGEKAGLVKDDVILQVGDRPVTNPDDVRNAAFFTTADDEVLIKLVRHGAELELKVIPTDHPSTAHTSWPAGGIPLSLPEPPPPAAAFAPTR